MKKRNEFPAGSIRWQFPMAILCLVLSWAGCSWAQPKSDSIRYYILDSREAENHPKTTGIKQAGAVRLRLAPIELPSYLQSKSLAIRSGSNEISYSDFDQWGERLDQGISRVLVKSLSAATNVISVNRQQGVRGSPDWDVRVRVLSCEGARTSTSVGSIRFEMSWEITSPGSSPPVILHGSYQAPSTVWNGSNVEELARQLSTAVANAAVQLASEIPQVPPPMGTSVQPSSSFHLPL